MFKYVLYLLISLLFTLVNYSESSWIFFNNIGGESLAKIFPELSGILFFSTISFFYLRNRYPGFVKKFKLNKKDYAAFLFLLLITLLYRFQQFKTYFFKDDIYLFLNHEGLSYNIFSFGPWFSSHSALLWEIIRYIFGIEILPYQFGVIFSHVIFSFGLFLFVKYISSSFKQAIFTSSLFAITTINFEAFQWLTHPISFGWQGFYIFITLMFLVYELEQTQSKKIILSPVFLVMAIISGGLARSTVILPLATIIDLFLSSKYFLGKNKKKYFLPFLYRQFLFYLLPLIFYFVRDLWGITKTRPEIVTASYGDIYLYLMGVFTFPQYIVNFLSRHLSILTGVITRYLGLVFTTVFGIYSLFIFFRKERENILFLTGFTLVLISAIYFTLFGPHVPVTRETLQTANGSHHLSYIAAAGSIIVWACILYQNFLERYLLKKKILYWLVICFIYISVFIFLNKMYRNFLDIPAGLSEVRTKFFFDTYKNFIKDDEGKAYVYYDDGHSIRWDNYSPSQRYFGGFWQHKYVDIIYGQKDLEIFYEKNKRSKSKYPLHYIYTNYFTNIYEDLSEVLLSQLEGKNVQHLTPSNLFVVFSGNENKIQKVGYSLENLRTPAILTPKLEFRLKYKNLANSYTSTFVPEKDFGQVAGHLLSHNTVACDTSLEKKEGLLIIYTGSNDGYLEKISKDQPVNIYSSSYFDRFAILCKKQISHGMTENITIELPYLGSYLRNISILPVGMGPDDFIVDSVKIIY